MAEQGITIEAAPAEQGILGGLASFKVLDIPIGAAATGALTAGLFDGVVGVIQGFVPGMPSWALKGLGSWAALQWGPRIVGSTPAQVAGLLLAYDAVQEFFNLRQSVKNVLGGILGGITKQSAPVATGAGNKVVAQATKVAQDYYAELGGR